MLWPPGWAGHLAHAAPGLLEPSVECAQSVDWLTGCASGHGRGECTAHGGIPARHLCCLRLAMCCCTAFGHDGVIAWQKVGWGCLRGPWWDTLVPGALPWKDGRPKAAVQAAGMIWVQPRAFWPVGNARRAAIIVCWGTLESGECMLQWQHGSMESLCWQLSAALLKAMERGRDRLGGAGGV